MTVQRRAFSGIVAGSANFLVTFALVLIQVPLLLNYWGAGLYGSWNALFAFYSLLITLDTGHQSYLGAIFMQKMHGDRAEVRKTIGSGIRMACVLGSFQLLLCLIIGVFELARSVIAADTEYVSGGELALSLAVLTVQWVIAGSIGGILVKIFSAGGQYTRATIWGIGYRLLFSIMLCTGAMATGRILPAALAIAVTITLYTFLQMCDLRRQFPDLYPWWKEGSWSAGWRNLGRSGLVTASGVIQQFSTNGLVLLVTHLLDTIAVALLTTLRTLANTAMQMTLIVVQPVLPDLIRYHVARDATKVSHTLAGLWFISGVIVNLGLAAAIAIAPPLYHYWTRGKLPYDVGLFALLAVGIQIRNIASPLLVYLSGLNEVGAQIKIAVGQTVATVMVSLISIQFLGIKGAGVGVLCGETVALVLAFQQVRRSAKSIGLAFGSRHLIFPLLGLALLSAGYVGDVCLPGHGLATGLLTLFTLLILALFNWRGLPFEVQERILSALPKSLGKVP